MKQKGRKSGAKLSIVPAHNPGATPRPLPARSLDKAAAALWHRVVSAYPGDYFGAGDLPLLREFCHTSETLLPECNSRIEAGAIDAGAIRELSTRTMLVKELATLASKLRLNVSSRSRPDAASITGALKGGARGVEELARALRDQDKRK